MSVCTQVVMFPVGTLEGLAMNSAAGAVVTALNVRHERISRQSWAAQYAAVAKAKHE